MIRHEQLLQSLVGIKSYSGEEVELKTYISGWFEKAGIATIVQGENLVVHIEGVDTTRAFIFNSHMDTVSKGDQDWTYGPWHPTIVDDKMVGLGTSDMKSGLTATMLLAEKIAAAGRPPVDMWFTYVAKEETDGSGTESFANWFKTAGHLEKYRDLAGVFTEPTGLKELEHGHRGNMFLKMTVEGDSGHGSRPRLLKRHSVREMIKFSDILQGEFSDWVKEFSDDKFEPPTIGEMTSIQAGVSIKKNGEEEVIEVESANKFPSVCIATFDIRTTPNFHRVAFDRIKELGNVCGVKVEYVFPPAPAGYTEPSEKIVRVTREIVPDIELTVSEGSADLGFLSVHGVKAVIFGPGEKNQSHKTDEYCYPDQIPKAVQVYGQIVEAWAR